MCRIFFQYVSQNTVIVIEKAKKFALEYIEKSQRRKSQKKFRI